MPRLTAFTRGVCCLIWSLVPTGHAKAAPITFSATQGNLSASATFETVGTNLRVTLRNASLHDVLVPADVLTAVFFNLGDGFTLTPVSAILGIGSGVLFGSSEPGGGVGGEWAYGAGLVGAPGGARRGISSAGFGLFGNANFPGSNLQGPTGVNGLQYGITSAGDNPATGNTPVTGGNALIKNEVVFTLSGLPSDYDPSQGVNQVSFQYGTSLTEPNTPEPATAAMVALMGMGLARGRRGTALR